MWVTPDDIAHLLPIDVLDGNGDIVTGQITGFDPERGIVECYKLDGKGRRVADKMGIYLRTKKAVPAPLTIRKKIR